MEYSHETRRYLAKVSRIGIVAAILYALIHGLFRYFEMCALGGITFPFRYLFGVGNSLIPEATVAVAGLLGLVVCGILSAAARNKPAVAETGWIIAGKITLLSAPVGYIHSLFGLGQMVVNAASFHKDFLFSFAALATVFVGYALGARGISMEQALQNTEKKLYIRRVLRNTAIVLGVMLAAFLLMLGRTWMTYREIFQGTTRLGTLLSVPLLTTLPVALAVTVGYPLLSLAARWDEAPSKGRFGKGTLLLGWLTLGISTLRSSVSILIQYRMLNYDASDLMGGFSGLQRLQPALSAAATLLGVWTLCGILARGRESKTVLWGARGVLGMVVLRYLSDWVVDTVAIIMQMNKDSSGMGIIGGADISLTIFTARAQSWLNMIFTVLSIAALVVLTVGLTRRCRVSKAFWAVPALTAASVVVPLGANVIWELIMRSENVTVDAVQRYSLVFSLAIPAVLLLARSLAGILALTRAPADEVRFEPENTENAEPPKMLLRVE